jgi:hypothetical protein
MSCRVNAASQTMTLAAAQRVRKGKVQNTFKSEDREGKDRIVHPFGLGMTAAEKITPLDLLVEMKNI